MTLVVVYLHKKKQKIKKQHHVLFVIAHPDDQVMFFRPSISSITKQYFVHLLCLSGGQSQRQEQLKKSAQNLKLHKCLCINNSNLKDSMQLQWPKQQIQQIVSNYINQNSIKAIFTFDQLGVSNHKNHKSIYEALKQYHYSKEQLKVLKKSEKSLTQRQKNQIQKIKNESIKIYHLKTVNLIRKYTAFVEIVFALLRDFSWINLNVFDAYKSMSVHKSQFVWFRKLWIFFSQYVYINVFTMTRIKINPQNKTPIQSQISQKSQRQQNQSINNDQTKKQR